MENWIIVTGANGGIGKAITEMLAKSGYPVVMACRDLERSMKVRNEIVGESGNRNIELLRLDLSSFHSIQDFVHQLDEREIGGLINNAGIMCKDFSITSDGLETTVGVNYVGPWLLTRLLLPFMGNGRVTRIVNTVSCTYKMGKIDDRFFIPDPLKFRRFKAYPASKLALLLFTVELAERLKDTSIRVNAVDPGVVNTGMITMHQWFDPLANILFRPFIKSPEKGADTSVWMMTSPECAESSGKLFASRQEKSIPSDMVASEKRNWLWEQTETLFLGKVQFTFCGK